MAAEHGKTKVVLTGTHCRPSGQGSGRRDNDLGPSNTSCRTALPAPTKPQHLAGHGWKEKQEPGGKGDGGRGGVIKGWAARQQPPVLGSVDQRDESKQMLRALSWCPALRVFDSFVRCGRYCRVSALRHWKRQSVVVENDVCLVGR